MAVKSQQQHEASLALVYDQQTKKVLLTKRFKPSKPHQHQRWQLPGGAMDPGENPEGALVRELREELQLQSIQIVSQQILELPNEDYDLQPTLYHVYLVLVSEDTTLSIEDDQEADDLKWVPLQQVEQLMVMPIVLLALQGFSLE